MKSLRTRMIISVTSIFVLALVTLATLNFFQARKVIQEDVQYKLEKTAENQAETIKRWFDVYKTQITTLARSPIVTSGDREETIKYLAEELKNNSSYLNIFLCYTNGEGYGADGTLSNVLNREYFQQALKGETVISDPVISKTTGKLIVAIATPIIITKK